MSYNDSPISKADWRRLWRTTVDPETALEMQIVFAMAKENKPASLHELKREVALPPLEIAGMHDRPFDDFLGKRFLYDGNFYLLSDKQKNIAETTIKIFNLFISDRAIDPNAILQKISSFLLSNDPPYFDTIAAVASFKSRSFSYGPFYWETLVYQAVRKSDMTRNELDQALETALEKHGDMPLTGLFPEYQQKLFENQGLYTFGDLGSLNFNAFLCLLIGDEGRFLGICKTLSDIPGVLRENYNQIISVLKEKELQVFTYRYGLQNGGEEETLETVGNRFQLTRERIRQIVANDFRKIDEHLGDLSVTVNVAFSFVAGPETAYVSYEKFDDFMGQKGFSKCLSAFFDNCFHLKGSQIHFCDDYGFLYRGGKDGKDSVFNAFVGGLNSHFSDALFDSFSLCEKRMIKKAYFHRGRTWIKRGIKSSDLLCEVVEDRFPDGFNPACQSDCQDIFNIWETVYGMDPIKPSRLRAVLESHPNRFVAKDKGVYFPARFVGDIDDEFRQRINGFIEEKSLPILYSTIFDRFQEEFKTLNINNRYTLKTVFDRNDSEYHHGRDSLMDLEGKTTFVQALVDYANSFPGIFSSEELQMRFPGATYMNFLYGLRSHGYLPLSGQKFIAKNKIVFSEEDREELKETISHLLAQSPAGSISQKRLFYSLQLFHSDWLKRFPMIITPSDLSSCIIAFLPEDFVSFRRLVFPVGAGGLKVYEMLLKYLSDLDVVTIDDINQFYAKSGVVQNKTFLGIFGDLSSTHMQVDFNRLVCLNKLSFDEDKQKAVAIAIDSLVGSLKKIDTRYFQAYSALPFTGMKWNKYVLVGYIRCYLEDIYMIHYTDFDYRIADFIIEKRAQENE